jgi:hypothetical protein
LLLFSNELRGVEGDDGEQGAHGQLRDFLVAVVGDVEDLLSEVGGDGRAAPRELVVDCLYELWFEIVVVLQIEFQHTSLGWR